MLLLDLDTQEVLYEACTLYCNLGKIRDTLNYTFPIQNRFKACFLKYVSTIFFLIFVLGMDICEVAAFLESFKKWAARKGSMLLLGLDAQEVRYSPLRGYLTHKKQPPPLEAP